MLINNFFSLTSEDRSKVKRIVKTTSRFNMLFVLLIDKLTNFIKSDDKLTEDLMVDLKNSRLFMEDISIAPNTKILKDTSILNRDKDSLNVDNCYMFISNQTNTGIVDFYVECGSVLSDKLYVYDKNGVLVVKDMIKENEPYLFIIRDRNPLIDRKHIISYPLGDDDEEVSDYDFDMIVKELDKNVVSTLHLKGSQPGEVESKILNKLTVLSMEYELDDTMNDVTETTIFNQDFSVKTELDEWVLIGDPEPLVKDGKFFINGDTSYHSGFENKIELNPKDNYDISFTVSQPKAGGPWNYLSIGLVNELFDNNIENGYSANHMSLFIDGGHNNTLDDEDFKMYACYYNSDYYIGQNTGEVYTIKIEARGETGKLFVNGVQLHTYENFNTDMNAMYFGAFGKGNAGYIKDLTIKRITYG